MVLYAGAGSDVSLQHLHQHLTPHHRGGFSCWSGHWWFSMLCYTDGLLSCYGGFQLMFINAFHDADGLCRRSAWTLGIAHDFCQRPTAAVAYPDLAPVVFLILYINARD